MFDFRFDLMRRSNLPILLHYDDRASMASGVESRPVLLDSELVSAALSIPSRDLIKGALLKAPLRKAMAGSIPDSVLRRKDKLGFAVPEGKWMRGTFGVWLCARACDGLEAFRYSLSELIDVSSLSAPLSPGACSGTPVWLLASLGVWARRFGANER